MSRDIVFLFAILVGLPTLVTSIVFLTFLYIIVPIQMKREKRIEIKLNEKLVNLCSFFGIPLEYKENLGTAGHILYHKDRTGRLLLDDCKIEVMEKYINEPYVLAHELGHYIAIKKYQDSTEEMADKMANELCCTLLSDKEQKNLEIALRVYFKTKPSK